MEYPEGLVINTYGSFDDLNTSKLTTLIEESLGKLLVPDYYGLIVPSTILIAENPEKYWGAIIAEDITPTTQYLDKVVVDPMFQGNGLGGSMLEMISVMHPSHVLRAKQGNPNQAIYQKKGYVMEPTKNWNLYSKGLDDHLKLMAYTHALNKQETLEALS